jgi:hypothetical protein
MRREICSSRAFKKAVACSWLFLIAAILSTKVALADPSLPAATFTPDLFFNNVEATNIGWAFNVTSPVWVSALGYFDYSEFSSDPTNGFCCSPLNTVPGLLDDHNVGIFNSTGTLLTSADVPAGTAGTLIADSFYSTVATIELTPGEYFLLGTQQGNGGVSPTDPVAFEFSSFSTLPQITALGGSYSYGGGPGVLNFGGGSIDGFQAYVGPNFLASDTAPSSPSPTPEPSSFILLGSGLVSLGGFIRRKFRA